MRNSKNKSVACTVPLGSDHCPQGGHSCCWCDCSASQAKVILGWGHGPAGNLRGENSPQRGPWNSSQVPACPRKFSLQLPCSLHPNNPALSPSHSMSTPDSIAETKTFALSLTPLLLSNHTCNLVTNPISLSRTRSIICGAWDQMKMEGRIQRLLRIPRRWEQNMNQAGVLLSKGSCVTPQSTRPWHWPWF